MTRMKYDIAKLQNAFNRNLAPDGKSWTYHKVRIAAGVGIGTVYRVIVQGVGHKDSADVVARVLGFRNGRFDVELKNGNRKRK